MIGKGRSIAGWFLPLALLALFFLWPVARLLATGITELRPQDFFSDRILSILRFTIGQAAVSSFFSVVLGLPGAYVLYLRRFRGQVYLRALITVPFILPSIVVAIAFTTLRDIPLLGSFLFGSSPVIAIIFAHLFVNYCLVVRIVGNIWSSCSSEYEDAAALDGAGQLRTFISVSLPQLKSAIASSALLVFLYSLTSFGIILVLGGGAVETIETEIYSQALKRLDLAQAAGLTLLQSLLTVAGFGLFALLNKASEEESAGSTGMRQKILAMRDWPVVLITFVVVAIIFIIPLIGVAAKSFNADGSMSFLHFSNLGGFGARDLLSISVGQALFNSLRNLIVATFIAMLVGVRVSYLLADLRTPSWLRHIGDALFQLPIGISNVVLGLGFLLTFSDGLLPLRSSWVVVPLVQGLIATPLVIRTVYPALASIDKHQIESASSEGANTRQIWRYIQTPLASSALRVACSYAALISLGEFGAASFLAFGDQATLPTILFQLISRPGDQNYGMAMAMSFLFIVTIFIVVLITELNWYDRRSWFIR